jgi:exodeoxyribonuclease VII large subunit
MSIKKFNNVSELNQEIKKIIDNFSSNKIEVSGEISNLKISNNHLFATLKDEKSCINIVYWSFGYLKEPIKLSNGDNIKITGKITQFTKSGNISFKIFDLEKIDGVGSFHKEYEELKKKYSELGYFDNKKEYPKKINNIGIITALKGAALQDMIFLLEKNMFVGNVYVKGCYVQGNNCPDSVTKNIELLDNWTNDKNEKLDLIVITRGGGSLEDLSGFSSPKIIEAIHKCSIFTVSAIGHEIDFMLSDFAADLRAPTPSIAAEMICEFQNKNKENYEIIRENILVNMGDNIKDIIHELNNRIEKLRLRVKSPNNYLEKELHKLTELRRVLCDNMHDIIKTKKIKLDNCKEKITVYDIENMLEKGYCLLRKNNKIINSVEQISKDQILKIKLKDGEIQVKVC